MTDLLNKKHVTNYGDAFAVTVLKEGGEISCSLGVVDLTDGVSGKGVASFSDNVGDIQKVINCLQAAIQEIEEFKNGN